ncbi:MAG: hypothetical protein ACI857_003421 [Arenicella sp.]
MSNHNSSKLIVPVRFSNFITHPRIAGQAKKELQINCFKSQRYQQTPDFVFINNERKEYYTPHDYNWCKDQLHGKIKEYEYSLRQLLKLHKSFERIQELAYRKNQLYEIVHVHREKWTEEFNAKRKKSIENSYQIMTMIEKDKTIQVSVQYSPKKAVFETVICQSGF